MKLLIVFMCLLILACGDPVKRVINTGVVDRIEPYALWYVVHFTDGNSYQFVGPHDFQRGDSVEVYRMSNENFQKVRKL